MKLITVLFLACLTVGRVSAGDGPDAPRFTDQKLEVIEANLKVALESASPGVQASAAQTVRDLKARAPHYEFASLVIPLMRIVKDGNAECGPRVLAALALHELKSELGDFPIQRTGRFTEDQRLKHVCTWLTYDRLLASGKVEPITDVASK